MVTLHELALGTSFEDLVVAVHRLEGPIDSAATQTTDQRVTVRDGTGFASLLYSGSGDCRVKTGQVYKLSGKAITSVEGGVPSKQFPPFSIWVFPIAAYSNVVSSERL